MWPRRSETLLVGLSHDRVEWQFSGRKPQAVSLPSAGIQSKQVAVMFESPPMSSKLAVVHVVVGSSLARHWLQTAPPGLRSLSELQTLVQSRAAQLFGGEAGWVVAADWHASRPFLCAALPREVERLASGIARTRNATSHLATSLSLALAQHARNLPADGWTVLHEPEAMHLLYLAGGRLEYLRTVVIPIGLEALALEEEAGAEVARSAALAGGLPTTPLAILSMSKDPNATQSSAALALATQADGGATS